MPGQPNHSYKKLRSDSQKNTLGGGGDGDYCQRVDLIPAPKKMAIKYMMEEKQFFSSFTHVYKSLY